MPAAALPIPHPSHQPPNFQAETVAPSPLHLLTSAPAQLLPPGTVSRLLTAALTVLEEVARTSTNPIERRRAATTILRYLFAPAPRAPRADKVPQGAGPPAPCADRARASHVARTPPRAPHTETRDEPQPIIRASVPTSPPSKPAYTPTLLAPHAATLPPTLLRTTGTPASAATLLTALATSHDIARHHPTIQPNAPPRLSSLPLLSLCSLCSLW